MTVSQANNITLTALAVAPANLTTDPYQTTQALSGLIGQLSIWTRHVADSLNVLYRAGTITNGMLLIGDATNSVFDLGTLTAGANATITNGAGTITVAVPGAIPPNPGTSGGIPYYNTTTSLASSALLAANSLVQGGGAGTAPFSAADWSILSNVLQGNLNSAALPAAPADTIARVAQADGHGTVLEMLTANNGSNVFNNIIGRHSRGTVAAPTATQNNDVINQWEGRGYDNTNGYATGATGAAAILATENWTSTAHGTDVAFYGTPQGSTTVTLSGWFGPNGSAAHGTTTNDNAPAGFDGEYAENSASTVNFVSGTPTDITSVSLTAGDWDVDGTVTTNASVADTISVLQGWINTTSATAPGFGKSGQFYFGGTMPAGGQLQLPTGPLRISTATTVTAFLSATVTHAGGTCGIYGEIRARRVR